MGNGVATLKKRDLIVTLLYFLDMAVLMLSFMFSIWMRNEFQAKALVKEITRGSFWLSMVVLAVIYACVFTLSRTYQVLWEYASMRDACIVAVCAMSSSIAFALIRTALKFPYFAPSVYIMAVLLSGAGVVAVRMVLRTLRRKPWRGITPKSNRNNTMIIGAGDAANILIHEIKTSPNMEYYPVCILDDSPDKKRSTVYGVKVIGKCDKIEEVAEKYNIKTIIFAIPSATPERKGEILRRCSKTGCVVKTLPSIGQMIDKKMGLSNIRSINIEDLLGRPPIKIKLDSVMDYVSGKTVLVTGGGGSIGSELCRQIAEHSPHKLIIFDIYENNAYNIQNELLRTHPEVNVKVLIDVRGRGIVCMPEHFLQEFRLDIVCYSPACECVPCCVWCFLRDSEPLQKRVVVTLAKICNDFLPGIPRDQKFAFCTLFEFCEIFTPFGANWDYSIPACFCLFPADHVGFMDIFGSKPEQLADSHTGIDHHQGKFGCLGTVRFELLDILF